MEAWIKPAVMNDRALGIAGGEKDLLRAGLRRSAASASSRPFMAPGMITSVNSRPGSEARNLRTGEGEWQVRGYPLPRPIRDDMMGSAWLERFALARFAIGAYRVLRDREIILPDPTEDIIGMGWRTVEAARSFSFSKWRSGLHSAPTSSGGVCKY